MALNQLSDKLDQISGSDLDVNFDDAAVWAKLEAKLDERKLVISSWWLAAACLVLFVLFPFQILKETNSSQTARVETNEVIPAEKLIREQPDLIEEFESVEATPLYEVTKKSVELSLAELTIIPKLNPIEIKKEKRRLQFAAEDISVIQASLEQPETKNGRTMTIRAQWQKSPAKSNVEYQALKIKLYDKQE